MRPPPVARVPRPPVPLPPAPEFDGCRVQGYLGEDRQLTHPPAERFPSEHAVILDDGVQVLHAGACQLQPLVPNLLVNEEMSPPGLLRRRIERRTSRKMPIAEVALEVVLRVQVARVHIQVRVVRIHTKEQAPEDEFPSEGDGNEDQETPDK